MKNNSDIKDAVLDYDLEESVQKKLSNLHRFAPGTPLDMIVQVKSVRTRKCYDDKVTQQIGITDNDTYKIFWGCCNQHSTV